MKATRPFPERVRRAGGCGRAVILQVGLAASFAATSPAQVPADSEFRVNTFTTGHQEGQQIAFGRAGEFVVTWTSRPECLPLPPPPPCGPAQDGSASGVFARRFDAAGVPDGEVQVNVATTQDQFRPAVAALSNGRFVVVWTSRYTGNGAAVVGRFLHSSGTPLGGEFLVTPSTSLNEQAAPSVAPLPGSEFVVVWNNGVSAYTDVRARRFDRDGLPIGAEFGPNVQPPGVFSPSPRVAADPAGTFVVAWTGTDADREGIFARRFDRFAAPLGPEFQVNTFTTGWQFRPRVAMRTDGGFLVTWTDQRGPNYAQRYDPAGVPQGSEFLIGITTTAGSLASVSGAGNGEVLITWPGDYVAGTGWTTIRGILYDPNGSPGPQFRVDSSATTFSKLGPVAGFDDVGNLVATWTSEPQDGHRTGVFGRRFVGLRPAGMTVDPVATSTSDGNGVFEPAETAAVEPAWRYLSSAAMLQPFDGSASAFSGPAGPSYTVLDASATYPVVAPNGTTRCRDAADCYSLAVAAPSGRPVLHWDATFREDLGPIAPLLSTQRTVHLGDSFGDVPRASPFYRFVETVLHNGVIGVCAPGLFCPQMNVTRDHMAAFILPAKDPSLIPPACVPGQEMFADVPASSDYCRWIEELARRGVVTGCGGGNYCPHLAVARDQLAVYLLRTLDPSLVPPACGTPLFTDVPASSPFCRWIEELARRGVVTGCGGGAYCPSLAVSREQMSVFLSVTFGLQLYGP